jgi:hypothetical protein
MARYGAVSVLSALLAQAGLAFGYGVLDMGVPETVLLSLALSAPVAYVLNRQFVWTRIERPGSEGGREVLGFGLLAVSGTLISMVAIAGALDLARTVTDAHTILTGVVDGVGLVSMVAVWMVRYLVLDRVVFGTQRLARLNPDPWKR